LPGLDQGGVLPALHSLVDTSLLRADEGAGGAARFSMLATIQAYGHECLAATGEQPAIGLRHAEHYLALAEEAAAQLRGSAQGAWLERLEEESGNLRAALHWALDRDSGPSEQRAALGLRLASALWRFWHVRGYLSEGQRWLEELLALAEEH